MTTHGEMARIGRGDMDEVHARNLRNVIAVLAEQRGITMAAGESFAAHLLDLVIMQLRLNLNDISDEELSGLSDFIGMELGDKPRH